MGGCIPSVIGYQTEIKYEPWSASRFSPTLSGEYRLDLGSASIVTMGEIQGHLPKDCC